MKSLPVGRSVPSSRGAAARAAVGKLAALLTGRPSNGKSKRDDDDDLPGPNATVPTFAALRLSALGVASLGGSGFALG